MTSMSRGRSWISAADVRHRIPHAVPRNSASAERSRRWGPPTRRRATEAVRSLKSPHHPPKDASVPPELLYSPSVKSSVLVYDSLLDSEAPVYRRPVTGEIGMWNAFSLSRDGARVCFLFREPGGGSSGPRASCLAVRFFPRSPRQSRRSSITALAAGTAPTTTPYFIGRAAAAPPQIYAVDDSAPGTPVVTSRPLESGEELENWWVARDGQRQVFGSRANFAPTSTLYSVFGRGTRDVHPVRRRLLR